MFTFSKNYPLIKITLSVSVLADIFPGGPRLAGTRMSPFWILLKLRMLVAVVTTAINRAKLQSNRHHQQVNTQILLNIFLKPLFALSNVVQQQFIGDVSNFVIF